MTPTPETPPASTSTETEAQSSSNPTSRGRAGYRQTELSTIPQGVATTFATGDAVKTAPDAKLYANYVQLFPMEKQSIYKYRVDFKPDVESVKFRRGLFREAAKVIFGDEVQVQFDGYSDARCRKETQEEENTVIVNHPTDKSEIHVKLKKVGSVLWGSYEMLRLYNMHMKKEILKVMDYFCVGQTGAYVHKDTEQPVGTGGQLSIIRGFRTSANIHEDDKILMNLEPCHKIMQKQNVLQYMYDLRNEINRQEGGPSALQDSLRTAMVGKLVVTGYNKFVYKVEDIAFNMNPTHKFTKKTGEEITFKDYFKNAHNLDIRDDKQPLLIAINNNRKKEQLQAAHGGDEDNSVKLIPELCNLAGMTDRQRTDNRIKLDMIRACQVSPNDRVNHMKDFLRKLHSNRIVKEKLEKWGYSYKDDAQKVMGRILPLQKIGIGRNEPKQPADWPKVDHTGSFDSLVMREKINIAPELKNCHLIISLGSKNYETSIVNRLKTGLNKVGVNIEELIVERIREGDAARLFVARLRQLPDNAKAVIVVLPHQDKEKYDAIKKYCSVERGLISQVVTTKLLTDERRAGGAITKIGIQIAAKLGGEPWRIHFPTQNTMFCGYDTYHDTSQRGRSYGAFVASVNNRYSQFWSKADRHDKLDELSTQLATNVGEAMKAFKRIHATKSWPQRIVIYRDGVSDGQIEHVFKVELESVKQKIKQLSQDVNLSFVVVNKRIGTRFYMKSGDTFINPSVGCVVDHTVTRNSRFDFYLVSQHTRQGTVTPTYYNIIFETSGLNAEKHQILAHSLCFLYYNWTGGVRVPAVCQYAHKLAYLCGEHLHATPNARLNERLHFL